MVPEEGSSFGRHPIRNWSEEAEAAWSGRAALAYPSALSRGHVMWLNWRFSRYGYGVHAPHWCHILPKLHDVFILWLKCTYGDKAILLLNSLEHHIHEDENADEKSLSFWENIKHKYSSNQLECKGSPPTPTV
jgi:hypothetical protein